MKELLEKINHKKNIVVTGDALSGKTTNVLFPLFNKIIDDNENIIVYDTKLEYLNNFYDKLIKNDYQIKIINLRDTNHSEGWNPLELAYYNYKNGNKDKAIELLENLANVFYPISKEADPFWNKTSSSLFIGLCLALFEDGDESIINMNSVNVFTTVGEEKGNVNNKYINEYFENKNKNDSSYIYASTTLIAPLQTRASILSVAKEPITKLVGNTQINNLLSRSTFNFRDISDKKMAIFVIGKPENQSVNIISNLFLNQIIQYLIEVIPNTRCHIVLDNIDNIDNLLGLNLYLELNNYSNIRFYIATRSIEDLNSRYMMNSNKISDVIRIKKDEIELESMGTIERCKNDFEKVLISKANIIYPNIKENEIKIFDLKRYVDTKRKERMTHLVESAARDLTNKNNTNKKPTTTDDFIKNIESKIIELKNKDKNTNQKTNIKKLENIIDEAIKKIENEKPDEKRKPKNEQLNLMNKKLILNNMKLHAKSLDVPILEGFNINRNDEKTQAKIIDCTNGQGLSMQLLSDGPLKPNESLEDRIKLIIDNTNKNLWEFSPLNSEKNIFYLKDFEGIFKFKVYIQDFLFDLNGKIRFSRLINAYFLEPKYNDFYQLTVASEGMEYPNENIIIGKFSDSDELTKELLKKIDYLMENIKYKTDVITTVEIPNDIRNKPFTEKEIKRITKNIDILKKQNIPYNENMKLIPSETNTRLSDKKTIFKNLMRKFILATFATTFMYEMDKEYFDFMYRQFDIQFKINSLLTDDDKKILDDIKNESLNVNKIKLSWLYEECAIYLWVMNLTDFPTQQQQCNVDMMNELLFLRTDFENKKNHPSKIFETLYDKNNKQLNLEKIQIKSYDEILEKADLLNRYRWASDEVRINNMPINLPFDSMIVYYQCNALFEILNWNDGSFI